jgi:threonine/homoserine/homoserine lactone efflux protein
MMPGPLLAVTIGESTRRGAHAGPLLVLGHAILEAALVAAVVLGLAKFLTQPTVIAVVSLVGGVIMAGMGASMILSSRRLTLNAPAGGGGTLHPVAAGIVVSLSNPYWTLWWATIGIGYLVVALRFRWVGVLVFFLGHILADLGWYAAVSFAVARGKRFLPDSAYRWMIAVCGGALGIFAVWFLWTGMTTLTAAGDH